MKNSAKPFDLIINSVDYKHNLDQIEKAIQTNPKKILNIFDGLIFDEPENPIIWTYNGFAFSQLSKKMMQ